MLIFQSKWLLVVFLDYMVFLLGVCASFLLILIDPLLNQTGKVNSTFTNMKKGCSCNYVCNCMLHADWPIIIFLFSLKNSWIVVITLLCLISAIKQKLMISELFKQKKVKHKSVIRQEAKMSILCCLKLFKHNECLLMFIRNLSQDGNNISYFIFILGFSFRIVLTENSF